MEPIKVTGEWRLCLVEEADVEGAFSLQKQEETRSFSFTDIYSDSRLQPWLNQMEIWVQEAWMKCFYPIEYILCWEGREYWFWTWKNMDLIQI